jgi:DNA-directed RNA polymerase subunit RPC12/RpoP
MNGQGIEGVRCPECGQNEVMNVVGLAWITVTGDGADYSDEPDCAAWDDTSFARCPSCGHEGTWGKFCCEEEEQ